MPKGPMIRLRTRTPDRPPAELGLIASPSSSHVMPQPPTATHTDADGGDEGDPEEFRMYTDEELEERIKRLSRKQTLALPDGAEKMRKFVYRMKKELDRRRAARPRKVDMGHEQAMQIIGGDDPCAFMPPPVENTSNHAPDKKLQESVCQVKKELDHRLAARPGKVRKRKGVATPWRGHSPYPDL